jgi:hypothetical protein
MILLARGSLLVWRDPADITGLSTLSPEISGKRLELLKEIVPKLSRVAVVGSSIRGNKGSLFIAAWDIRGIGRADSKRSKLRKRLQ